MATVDTSLYATFGVKPKSSDDYAEERMRREDAKDRRESNRLALMIQQGAYGDQLAQRERGNRLLTLAQGVSDPQELVKRYREGGFHAEADAALRRQADIAKENAQADKERLLGAKEQIGLVLQAVSAAKDPQSYAQALQFLNANGIDTAGAPAQFDPAAVQSFGQMALTAAQRLEQEWKAKKFDQEARNDLIGPDGKVNQQVLGAKQSVAKAGASNISVSTEKSYAGNVAEGLAKNDVAALDAARAAPDRVRTARSIKQVLDSNKALTGTGAGVRLELTKALSTAGLIDGASTTATEDLVSMLSTQTLDAIKTSGMGSGQGFTDKDRQFLQDAKSGRIENNAATLRRIAELNERAGLATIEYGNKIAKRLKGNPAMGNVGQDLEVQAPDDPFQKAIADEARRRGLTK